MKIPKKSIHASIVDQSFEDLDRLAARAAEDDEVIDENEDLEDEDADEGDDEFETEDGDEDDSDSDEDGDEEFETEDGDEDSDEDSDEDDSDSDDDVDSDYADEGDDEFETEDGDEAEGEEEEIEFEEDDSDSASDSDDEDEFVTEDDEDGDDEDEARAREEEVIAQLQAEGIACVVGSAAAISARELGVAIASLEEDEFGEDEEVDADTDDEEEVEVEVEVDADEDEDLVEEDEDDMDSDSDDEDEFVTEDDEDGDDEADADTDDEEEVEVDADEDEDGDEEVEVDADEDEDLDEDRLAPVADEDFLAAASVSDVDLVFHADARNPVWNVIVAGVPAARIALSSFGVGASEIAKFFVTPEYATGLKRAMASEGVANLLKKSNAEFYASTYKSSSLFAEASASAEQVANQKVTAALAGLREDFVDALKIVSAGLDKNFFANKPNHLKRALFIKLAEAGVQNPAQVIEAAFRENGKHFETIAEMATELLDKPQDVRDTLRQSIDEAGLIERSAPAQASVIASANPGLELAKSFAATASTEVRTGNLEGSVAQRKDTLRGLLS